MAVKIEAHAASGTVPACLDVGDRRTQDAMRGNWKLFPYVAQFGRAASTMILLPLAAHAWEPADLGRFFAFYTGSLAVGILVDRGFLSSGYHILGSAGGDGEAVLAVMIRRRLTTVAVLCALTLAVCLAIPGATALIVGTLLFGVGVGLSLTIVFNLEDSGGRFVVSELAVPVAVLLAPILTLAARWPIGPAYVCAAIVGLGATLIVMLSRVCVARILQRSALDRAQRAALRGSDAVMIARLSTFMFTLLSVPLSAWLYGPAAGAKIGLAERTNGVMALLVVPTGNVLAAETARGGPNRARHSLIRVNRVSAVFCALWLVYAALIVFAYDKVAGLIFGARNAVEAPLMLLFAITYLFTGLNTFRLTGFATALGAFRMQLAAAVLAAVVFMTSALALRPWGYFTIGWARIASELTIFAATVVFIRLLRLHTAPPGEASAVQAFPEQLE
jgi:hypothetical protein